jgi:murein DD-endopeptidase MepM/ murein hydrolase activator NlpD
VDGDFLLRRPIAAPGSEVVDPGYPYGSTLGGTRQPHHGVEFYNASGTPVLAAADGTVIYAGDDGVELFSPWPNFYGNLVLLEHNLGGQNLYTLYAHLSKVDVIAGQVVAAGEKIAEVGASGSASGSHLHFEVRLAAQNYDSTRNPYLWLIPLPETGALSMRFVNAGGQFIQAQPNVQYFPNPDGLPVQAWQPELYAPGMPTSWENALLGDLPSGRYRITYLWSGVLYERWVEIQPGKLTLVSFEVP